MGIDTESPYVLFSSDSSFEAEGLIEEFWQDFLDSLTEEQREELTREGEIGGMGR